MALLFVVTAAVRLGLLLPWIQENPGEVWDAYGYYVRGGSLRDALVGLLHGQVPERAQFWTVYRGLWPPLQTLILAGVFLPFGTSIATGQIAMIVISALTAPLVYCTTLKFSGPRAAVIASLVYALYPSFIHLSLRLLSETPCFFLSMALLWLAVTTVEAVEPRRVYWYACLTGVVMGLAALTRAMTLPWIPAVTAWVAWRSRSPVRRLAVATAVLGATLVTVAPWQALLLRVDRRPVLLATCADENLYLGNNPWIPAGFGGYHSIVRPHMEQTAQAYGALHNISEEEAYRHLALKEIGDHPWLFLVRGVYKLQELWSFDRDIVGFVLSAIYPPAPVAFVSVVLALTVIALPFAVASALWGLLGAGMALKHASLIVALVGASMLLTFVSRGEEPRFHVALLAVLLPAIGHGLASARALASP